ncbi:MAG: GNAT family N-acetyltransferase [Ruminococcaceae bacterium]|nr:GNAT family N-acetyltransferase [Oscillospiraceae bacterium]
MKEHTIYKGRAKAEMYDELMDMLNYVFGFSSADYDFQKLLPKLYADKKQACHDNYIVAEGGKIKAAVGAFDDIISVCGEEIKCRGIGNVAVHPYSRSKGYMIDCMNMSINDMIEDGVDISFLGGHRQRYGYFGFEDGCPRYNVRITTTSAHHYFKNVATEAVEIRDVSENDTEIIDKIFALYEKKPQRSIRPRDRFYQILRSWTHQPRAFFIGGEFVGYGIGGINELTLTDIKYFDSVIHAFAQMHGDINLGIPAWNTELFEAALRVGDSPSINESYMLSVFNYKKVVGTLLKLKASLEPLQDGAVTVLIHGYAGDCKLKLSVVDGKSSVEDYDGEAEIELSHKDAAKFFFGIHSPHWKKLTHATRAWLPLPLYVEDADHV